MAETRLHPILNYLRQVVSTAASGGVSDAELLRRFVDGHDEAAFELLLWRHAGMVLHVCRQVLRDPQAVEDAFQATFLVFVRKAGSISRRESLGSWLYRVAYRIALKARIQAAKRKSAEQDWQRIEEPIAPTDGEDSDQRELRRLICAEVQHLPAKFRAAVIACYFEGKTLEEAGLQLGWPRGTVSSRLARARQLLHRRLVRRGVTLTAGTFLAALPTQGVQAALTGLIESTIRSAKLFTAGRAADAAVPPHIADLAEGALKTMYGTRIKIIVTVLLLAGVGGVGTAFWSTEPSAAEPPPGENAAAPKAVTDANKPDDARTIARNMALSRLNLRKLALAFQNYGDTHRGILLPPAVIDKDGKPLLSWRVLLLPYLDELELYQQFKLSEAWDGTNNKKLLSKMPKVFAPPGVKTQQPYCTFYQAFVSPKPKAGEVAGLSAAFVEGQQARFPASFTDGLSNTILFIEAGQAVPWSSPEDLPFAADTPLPKLGGLFPDVIQAVFASGDAIVLTKHYEEMALRCAITPSGGEILPLDKIEALSPDTIGRRKELELRRKNLELRENLEDARQRLQRRKEERDALNGRASEVKQPPAAAPRLDELKQEQVRLQKELEKITEEMRAVNNEIFRRLQNPPK